MQAIICCFGEPTLVVSRGPRGREDILIGWLNITITRKTVCFHVYIEDTEP